MEQAPAHRTDVLDGLVIAIDDAATISSGIRLGRIAHQVQSTLAEGRGLGVAARAS
ncbi:MAG: hypothetical protein ACUVQI_07345 [Thermochromatium sp.]